MADETPARRRDDRRATHHISRHNQGLYFNPAYGDIICVRGPGVDEYRTNCPLRVKHHSPTGIAWGYAGSGPADLALNVLDVYLPTNWRVPGSKGRPKERTTQVWSGHFVSDEAFNLHQEFKRRFIVGMPEEGGVIPGDIIRDWLRMQGIDWQPIIWFREDGS